MPDLTAAEYEILVRDQMSTLSLAIHRMCNEANGDYADALCAIQQIKRLADSDRHRSGQPAPTHGGLTMPTVAETFEELQRVLKNSRDARSACVNPYHDHDTYMIVTGETVGEPVAMFCWGHIVTGPGEEEYELCGVAAHWDSAIEDFVHDDPTIPPCDMATSTRVNPCRSAVEVRAQRRQALDAIASQINEGLRGPS